MKVGDEVYNVNLDKKEKISRIFKIHANHRDRIEEAQNRGNCRDCRVKGNLNRPHTNKTKPILLEPIEIYQPVISIAVEPKRNVDQDKLLLALQRISEEDPTFILKADEDAYQTVVSGMGELAS